MSESLESLAERMRRGFGLRYAPWNRQVNADLDAFLQRAQEAERLATENGRLAQTHWDRAESAEARERKLREALTIIASLDGSSNADRYRVQAAVNIARAALRSLDSEGEGDELYELRAAFKEVVGYLHAYRKGADAGPEVGWAIRNFNEVADGLRSLDSEGGGG